MTLTVQEWGTIVVVAFFGIKFLRLCSDVSDINKKFPKPVERSQK